MSPALVSTENHVKEYYNVNDDPGEYVESVKPGNKEEEIGKEATTVFVPPKVGPLNHQSGLIYFFQRFFLILQLQCLNLLIWANVDHVAQLNQQESRLLAFD